MIDFTEYPISTKTYGGGNGKKLSVIYKGERYMLKFPATAHRNVDMGYSHSCVSEYLGSHIFNIVGVPAQETLLGTYKIKGDEKIVVACKDFLSQGESLQDFGSLKNTVFSSSSSGYGTDLLDVLTTIREQNFFDPIKLEEKFWDIFIVDALIGNWDRHNGNWGFIRDEKTDQLRFAPIFDCGSCLLPQADERIMRSVLTDKNELNLRIFEIPLSALKIDNKKIRYFDFISSFEYEGCNKALRRLVPKMDIDAINGLVDSTPYISDLQKDFYKTILSERKEKILDYSLGKLLSKEQRPPEIEPKETGPTMDPKPKEPEKDL